MMPHRLSQYYRKDEDLVEHKVDGMLVDMELNSGTILRESESLFIVLNISLILVKRQDSCVLTRIGIQIYTE